MGKFHCFIFCFCLFVSCRQETGPLKNNLSVDSTTQNLDTLSDKYIIAQQFVVKCDTVSLRNLDNLKKQLIRLQPGGVYFENWPIDAIQNLATFMDTTFKIKPFLMGDYFKLTDLSVYPIWAANKSFQDKQFWTGFQESGLNWLGMEEGLFNDKITTTYFKKLYADSIVNTVVKIKMKPLGEEALKKKLVLIQHTHHTLLLDAYYLDSLPYQQIRDDFDFEGLFIVNSERNPIHHIKTGADMVVIQDLNAFMVGDLKLRAHTKSTVSKILAIKNRFKSSGNFGGMPARMKANRYHIQIKSTVLIANENRLLPMKKLYFVDYQRLLQTKKPIGIKKGVCLLPFTLQDSVLDVLCVHPSANAMVFVFSNPKQWNKLKGAPNLCYTPWGHSKLLNAQLLGGLPIDGHFFNGKKFYKGKTLPKSKLAYVPSEYAFVDPKELKRISGMVNEAMNGRAFPGCQVLAVRNGVVVYQRNFGNSTYSNGLKVSNLHVYDLASLTKVLSTTLVGMKLWEDGYYKMEDKIGDYLPDSLSAYLPNGSSIKEITFQELFIHQSGLPAGFPVLPYMKKAADKETRFYNGFCDYPYSGYGTQVANNLYMDESYQDSMWLKMNTLWLDPKREYKYSDVNMNLLYFLFKRIIDTHAALKPKKLYRNRNTYEEYVHQTFYAPLEMTKTGFKPLNYTVLSKIVPTENESYWRKQLLQGFVHDPNAALYGGVAGNAGLFSNVKDLAILLEMWQNGGVYNGKRYLKSETISMFSKSQTGTHRGLGFNKRTFDNAAYGMADAAHSSTYGHTGFTGTCFWVDPSEKLSFIFLSNRVHPKISNKIYQYKVRKRIHEVFYEALLN
ncbi:serine hydrolase domain-containing protein [Putridiphycobacter roseus]|nr:serine hydrolase [Putridiphycobacter roseus]